MSRRFCVVYHVDTDFRLMETSAGEPAAWRMEMMSDGVSSDIEVRDLVQMENDIPVHVGLQIAVATSAPDLDAGVESAGRLSETVVSLLSASARSYAPELQPFVAYEITPGTTEHPFIQWFAMPTLLTGKTPVPSSVFGALFERLPALTDESWAQRIRLSLDWHRAALRETEPLFRFMNLMIALESIGNPLAEYYSEEKQGYKGLRRLADDEGLKSEFISEILDVRRIIFHGLRERPADVRLRAVAANPNMERLLITGWMHLLGVSDKIADYPRSATTRHPMRHKLRGTIHETDASQWGNGIHPHFDGGLTLQRKSVTDPKTVTVSFVFNTQPRHIGQFRVEATELWGPSGPNAPKVEHSVTVTKKDEQSAR